MRPARVLLLWIKTRPWRFAAGLASLIVAAGAGALIFAWSGLYNVAASKGHLAATDWFLRFGMVHSVRTLRLERATSPIG